jgi:hypothetical protein
VLPDLSDELLAEFDAPMSIGPVITVDTTGEIDVMRIAREIERLSRSRPEAASS